MAGEEKGKGQKFNLKVEIIENMATLVIASFGFVAALTWHGTLILIFTTIFGPDPTILIAVIQALSITIIAVFATLIIARTKAKIIPEVKKDETQ